LLEPLEPTDDNRLRQARVLDSLAEQLARGTPTEQAEARGRFERSLAIRREGGLGDLPGQARALGGLGRLNLVSDPPDYVAAARYLAEDLHLSEEIGDAVGQSMCHTLLGRCERALGHWDAALSHFRQAQQAAPGVKDQLFAKAGMLDVALVLGRQEEAAAIGRDLLAQAEAGPMPALCADEIARVVALHADALRDGWGPALVDRLARR
jgi:hypothetical protein